MAKVRSLEELDATLSAELSWRKKELSYLRSQVRSASGAVQEAWIRAGLTMLYAHWEGAIKACAEAYLHYLSETIGRRSVPLSDLAPNVAALAIWAELKGLGLQTASESVCRAVLAFDRGRVVKVPWQKVIDAESNLNWKTFQEILAQVGVEQAPYVSKQKLVDESLVGLRNEIAHGGRRSIVAAQYLELHDEVVRLITRFSDEVENAAVLQLYRTHGAADADSAERAGGLDSR